MHDLSPQQEVLQSSPALLAQLPLEKRARYCYLVGVLAQKQGDYHGAIEALETALALAEEKYRRLILDELGNCYSQLRIYQSALVYHLRALHALNANEEAQDLERIRFRMELHCLDFCSLRRKIALLRGDDMSNEVLRININSLLEDAVEQCKQVFISLRENVSSKADSYFQASLEYAQKSSTTQGEVHGDILRAYHHYVSLLEERLQAGEHVVTLPQLEVLKCNLGELHTRFSLVQKGVAFHPRSV